MYLRFKISSRPNRKRQTDILTAGGKSLISSHVWWMMKYVLAPQENGMSWRLLIGRPQVYKQRDHDFTFAYIHYSVRCYRSTFLSTLQHATRIIEAVTSRSDNQESPRSYGTQARSRSGLQHEATIQPASHPCNVLLGQAEQRSRSAPGQQVQACVHLPYHGLPSFSARDRERAGTPQRIGYWSPFGLQPPSCSVPVGRRARRHNLRGLDLLQLQRRRSHRQRASRSHWSNSRVRDRTTGSGNQPTPVCYEAGPTRPERQVRFLASSF